ncbi:ABC transporter permease [Ulvibacter litoralis]|uniref:Lipoprotein-releasing system permease protein n=1 Tax=Ulvibacter litoralis TaxID=227084 RepID=A0A1G7DBN3_9FLAO|nr:FtsX-like permease family protein [Ulvibacter litoralis]GHC44151.1 membrane protein [Ulvibacter litoralis]SDE48919.1 lipoprotein-releasing system permease protein [Ulvibacter litoralis]
MNFPLYIAKRYLFSKSSNNAINIITIIAAIGVVVGAVALFIVLSGFAGLKDFSLQFSSVFDSDLKITPANGKTLQFTKNSEEKLKNIEGIEAFSKIIEERVFLHFKDKNEITYIKGVDQNFGNVIQTDSILAYDYWFIPGQNEVVIGIGTSQKLSLGTRDYGNLLEIYVPKPYEGQKLDPTQVFNKQQVVVTGIYDVNLDLNNKYIFSDIDFARNLLKVDSTSISAIELKLAPGVSEKDIRKEIEVLFSEDILLKNRIQQNDALYKMLNTENIAVYLIFTLVLIIALFNVIGSIIMMILDKRKNIKTLYNMGADLKDIRKIFFLQGTLMTVLGGLLGIVIGVLVVAAQLKFKFINITASLPYPVKLEPINIVIVFATISILGLVASKIASSRVREKLLL